MSKVKHIVLVKFKDGTTDKQIGVFFEQVLDLSESIAGVEDYVSGPNCSPEGMSQGLTHGFVMTFTAAAARDAYLAHAEHQQFKTMAAGIVESTVVFDFEI